MTRVSKAVKVEKRWRMQGTTGFTSRVSRAFFIRELLRARTLRARSGRGSLGRSNGRPEQGGFIFDAGKRAPSFLARGLINRLNKKEIKF
jgi:hypothetical protein